MSGALQMRAPEKALMGIVLVAAYSHNITFEILKYSIDSTSI